MGNGKSPLGNVFTGVYLDIHAQGPLKGHSFLPPPSSSHQSPECSTVDGPIIADFGLYLKSVSRYSHSFFYCLTTVVLICPPPLPPPHPPPPSILCPFGVVRGSFIHVP